MFQALHKLVFLSVLTLWTRCVLSYNISDMQALRKHLFEDSGYNKKVRPVINQSELTEVSVQFVIKFFTLHTWIEMFELTAFYSATKLIQTQSFIFVK